MARKESPASSASGVSASEPLLTVAKSFDLRFSPDSQLVAATGDGRVWEVRTGTEVFKCKVPPDAMGLQFSPDGGCLAAIATGGVVSVYDPNTGAVVRKIKAVGSGEFAFDPSGKWIATANDETGLSLWDLATGDPVNRISLDGRFPWGLGWYPGRTLWVHTSEKNSAVLLTFDTKLKCKSETNLKRAAERVVPHPKQKNGIVATDAGKLLLYEDSKVTRQAKLKVARVNSLAVSPDGKWIAVVAPDTFLLFDAKDFSLRAERKMGECLSACFSRDSKLVSIATQKKGEVWDTAQLIGTGSATK